MIKLPKERRGFFCTKCHSRLCVEGTIEQQHPPCAKCGYLGFAQDQGYDLAQLKQAVRDAIEKSAQICMDLLVTDCNDSNLTRHECADEIRALIKEIAA